MVPEMFEPLRFDCNCEYFLDFQYCRQVWLGLYDNSMSSQTESREENKVKDFMSQKYERKRWYVAPSESLQEKARKLNESVITKQQTKPLKSLLGENAPRLVVGNSQVFLCTVYDDRKRHSSR